MLKYAKTQTKPKQKKTDTIDCKSGPERKAWILSVSVIL